ncbi:uracil-DNA glycosylase [Paenibacillus montaniterrae]|uniref:Uracil-DNA glycosylase n=1 Tax=Paenibacillus montaniterrae TaxID=429341 RepID=A0A919YNM5_9BACL|nr:uracil-DNA glycosylase [Paenibacillus montaniterrae]GIP17203.1 uracil-DNA glycosylase [Paenibacillus montaniterrae]
MKILQNDWAHYLEAEFEKDYYIKLRQALKQEYSRATVYPDMYHIFNALHMTPYAETKVLILGQDPYHGPGQAHGLSFSVQEGVPFPPSLRNMLKELQDDLGIPLPKHGCLEKWAKQGVLLLNSVLTVRQGEPNSHRMLGWELFTDRVIEVLNEREQPIVFILWGRHAQDKLRMIDRDRHFVLMSPHPSPLSASRGFFGSRPYSKTNEFLRSIGQQEIDWAL